MAAALVSMCQYWKGFNIGELQRELDNTATALASRQDASDVSRKQLVEQSRDFKRTAPEDARKQVAPVLKSFQGEIDALSKRSKAAESAFLSVYKRLVDVPDPCPAFEHALGLQKRAQRAGDLEIENEKLRETLEEYNSEFAEVKNQEVTIKNLREKVRDYERRLEETAEEKAAEKEREIVRQFALKERSIVDEKVELARKLGEAELRANTLQSAIEQAQSEQFDLKTKYDEATSTRSDEVEMIMADLDRAAERAAGAERQLEQERAQQATSQHEAVAEAESAEARADSALRVSQLEAELGAKEKEVSQLVEEVQRLQAALSRQRDTGSSRVSALEEALNEKAEMIDRLQKQLDDVSDYEEIKKELSVLKSLEYSDGKTDDGSPKSLETLLLEKNRQLQDENTQLKKATSDTADELVKVQRKEAEGAASLAEMKQLNTQLEEDLRNVNALSSLFRGDAEGQAGPTSPGTEVIAEAVLDTAAPSKESLGAASGSLLGIVQSQRERFRTRAQELEAQVLSQQQTIGVMMSETDKLRSDNVKLYEKIRYLQSYSGQKTRGDDRTEQRYLSDYEAGLDPFSNFTRKERQRKYGDLKPYDKITLSMGRFVMGNRAARVFCFFYTLIMHCLVFLVLYSYAYNESSKRDLAAECHQKFAEHMVHAHGDH